jgi:hypothetical protein
MAAARSGHQFRRVFDNRNAVVIDTVAVCDEK